MIIRNAEIYSPQFRFRPGTILIEGGTIARVIWEDTGSTPAKECHTAESTGSMLTAESTGSTLTAESTGSTLTAESTGGTLTADSHTVRDTDTVIDASGCYAIPGLVDIHLHGCMGADFCDGTYEAIRTIAAYEARHGITAICPATLTLPVEELCHVVAQGAAFAREQARRKRCRKGQNYDAKQTAHDHGGRPDPGEVQASHAHEASHTHEASQASYDPDAKQTACGDICADLVGINMEGPFISPVKCGAQNKAHIIGCDTGICERFLRDSEGLVKIIGIAPEENEEYAFFIDSMKDKVRISLAHTNAGYSTAMAAFEAGASHVVHLFNAMPEYLHRSPGVIGAAADSPRVTAELICDGEHVHGSVVRGAFDMIGEDRLVLISDSLRATGMGDGIIDLGGMTVKVEGKRAILEDGGNLAGSVTNLMDCMRVLVQEMGVPLEKAVRCATANPARVIGEDNIRGSIEAGRIADVVLLDRKDLRLRGVIREGTLGA